MLIQIDGWFAGGKSVLWSLLDGHSEIFVNPIHDFSHTYLIDEKIDDEWLQKKHTVYLRQLLAKAEYYKFERIYYEKFLEIGYSVDNIQRIKYDVDFYQFDKLFFNRLKSKDYWNIENIIETLYESYYEIYNPKSKVPKYFATMSNPSMYMSYINIPSTFPNMKTVIVKRDIKNIIASRTNRKERPSDLSKLEVFRTSFNTILKRNEIEEISDYFKVNLDLQAKYPKQFMVVEFDDLVKDTENTMKKVAKFLEIEYEDILSKPTRDGQVLEYNGMSFIGQENDDYRKLLTSDEIKIIDKRIKIYKIFKKPYYVFSLKDQLRNLFNILKKVAKNVL